ncbi:protein jagged-1b-like [Heteronotia binoei]|uniref:protein jagged-1b-like n=1 Tax=Heteronotia binoei TaxID=13085 RepID=UPI00292D7667|nr:protein jagged-1b-like [Heteronotia binoei]
MVQRSTGQPSAFRNVRTGRGSAPGVRRSRSCSAGKGEAGAAAAPPAGRASPRSARPALIGSGARAATPPACRSEAGLGLAGAAGRGSAERLRAGALAGAGLQVAAGRCPPFRLPGRPAGETMRLGAPRWVPALLLLLLLLHPRLQGLDAAGTFELQIRFVRNEKGVLADGRCCRGALEPPCPRTDQCRTFFRACLKEYQLRVLPGGPCVLGAAATPVLGGNVFSTGHRKGPDSAHKMVVRFDFAWPRSYSLVLEAWHAANVSDVTTQGAGQLMERVTRSGMLNPGEGWEDLWHHGRGTSLEYRVRVRCQEYYYGPMCNLLCRPRDDFFGHHSCDSAGNKVCLDGWTGDECTQAICRPGCHEMHGFCEEPNECRCHYGWTGPLCDKCILFPGCVHGSCSEPWKCNCETNWGGLLCDKNLNYCGSHRPCENGGTCANKEPDEYECLCPEGFQGRNCENALLPLPVAESTCSSDLCSNGGTCLRGPSGFWCICPPGWSGESCQNEVTDCLSEPCSHGGTCQNIPGDFKCSCPPQWTGKTCQIDVNECQTDPCLHAQGCKNLIGGYFCDCLEGWAGPNCEIREDACQRQCRNGGTCQVKNGRHACVCLAEYTGVECETELGACASAPCLHGGQCQETGNMTFRCSCSPGRSGQRCEKAPGDLCFSNPCPEGSSCLSGKDNYICTCPDGAECQRIQEPCPEGVCPGGTNVILLYTVLPLALLLVLAVPVSALLALWINRKSRETPPAPLDPAANNVLQPDAVHLIRNITHGDAESGLREPGSAVKVGLPLTLRPPCGLPKTDISNAERAKLNRLNGSPALPQPLL